jgi:hypothetical protein
MPACIARQVPPLAASMSALASSDGEGMVEGLDCSCPDNCDEVLYSQEVSSGPFVDTNNNFFRKLTGKMLF